MIAAFGAVAAAVGVRREDTGKLAALATRGYPPHLTRLWFNEAYGVNAVVEAMDTGRVVWFPSWDAYHAYHPGALLPIASLRRGARAAVPLMIRERAIGVFYMNFEEERRFGPDELDVMLMFGGHCAQALERARLVHRDPGSHPAPSGPQHSSGNGIDGMR